MSRSQRVHDAWCPKLSTRLEADLASALGQPHAHLQCGWHCTRNAPLPVPLSLSVFAAELRRRGWAPRRAALFARRFFDGWRYDLPDHEMKQLQKRAARHRAKQLIALGRWDDIAVFRRGGVSAW